MWPLDRSRSQCRLPELDLRSGDKVPRGIVELCQCIKSTSSKKQTLFAYLGRQRQKQGIGAQKVSEQARYRTVDLGCMRFKRFIVPGG